MSSLETLLTGQPGIDPSALQPGDKGRARLMHLLDDDSLVELGSRRQHDKSAFGLDRRRPEGDGVVAGSGRVDGRAVVVYAQDGTVLGGSLGEAHADKIQRALAQAVKGGSPVIGINDSGGARIQEGVAALDGYGGVFSGNVAASGRVPQIAVLLGPCAGGAVYSPALMDFIIMADHGTMFLTGPRVVKAVTGEDVSARDLGGPELHGSTSGVAHFTVGDEAEALDLARELLGYLPTSCDDVPPVVEPEEPDEVDLATLVPADGAQPYDVRDVIAGIVDGGRFLEVQRDWAKNVVIGFARLDGHSIGIVANQAAWLAGTLDATASEKAARFVRFLDAFGLPIVSLVDVPGFLPGSSQERNGVIRKGAKLLHAYTNATVPRVTVVMRKAFGGAYIVMNSRSIGADAVLAWPGAELAVMGAEGAADVIFRRQIAEDPSAREQLADQYRDEAMDVQLAAGRGSVDEIIKPSETRTALIQLLAARRPSRARGFAHDNLPQ